MSRKKISGIAVRESGGDLLVYDNADVTIYQAGTATEITVYETESGSGTNIQTESNGYFEFWIPFDTNNVVIKTVISKTGYSDLVEEYYPAFPRDIFLNNSSNVPGDSIYDALENLTKKYKIFQSDMDGTYDGYKIDVIPSGGGATRVNIYFPDDLHTIIDINVIIISGNADSATDIDFESAYAGLGESPLTNTESDTSSTYDLAYNKWEAIQVTDLFSSVEAGDFGRLEIQNNEAWDLHLLAIILNYTSYPGN